MTELRKELIEWITAYKDVAERHALAETPEESADYLLSLEPLAALLKLYEQTAETCPKCKGRGKISKRHGTARRIIHSIVSCPFCSGTGKVHNLDRLIELIELADGDIKRLVVLDEVKT
jgi:hypothetical protein